MSISPFFFDYDDFPRRWPRRIIGQNFGNAFTTDDLFSSVSSRYRNTGSKANDSNITSEDNKENFTISVDVQHFEPEELVVKTVDGYIVVEGKHEEKKDEFGFVTRHISRRFKLPDDCNQEAVESRLSSDGVLTVVAPKKAQVAPGERKIPIIPTGPTRKPAEPAAL